MSSTVENQSCVPFHPTGLVLALSVDRSITITVSEEILTDQNRKIPDNPVRRFDLFVNNGQWSRGFDFPYRIVLFLLVHILLALAVPRTLVAMVTGGPKVDPSSPEGMQSDPQAPSDNDAMGRRGPGA